MNRFIILFATAICVNTVHAEPSGSTKYLYNTPASILEVGMMNLEKYLISFGAANAYLSGHSRHRIFTKYDYGKDRIIIKYAGYTKKIPNKKMCKEIIFSLKGAFRIDPKTGNINTQSDSKLVAQYFTLDGYYKKTSPKNWMRDLEKKVILKADVIYDKNIGDIIGCQSDLTSTAILFSD